MRTFDGNLNAYHALNAQCASFNSRQMVKMRNASTIKEKKPILQESLAYYDKQKESYKELGEEMVAIMSKKWWQFWKEEGLE